MRQNELELLVSGIKQLNAVLVVMVPDCLLFTAWQRPGQTWDTETAGAYLGELMHSTEQGAQALDGWSGGPASITLESEAGLIVVREVKEPFVVAYLFDKGTAIGWARLQIQRTLGNIEQTLEGVDSSQVAAPAPIRTEVKAAPPPRPSRPAPAPAPRPAPAPAARPAPAPRPVAAAPAPAKPAAAPAQPAPRPAAASTPAVTRVTPPSATPKAPETKPAAAAAAQPASPTLGHDPTPKGTRLIKYLDAHAPDTHAALLRVSLQTGLPLTLLRMPDSLSDDEFAQVEESVRRILGVDQLNF